MLGSPAPSSPGGRRPNAPVQPEIYQIIHSTVQFSTTAGSAEVDTWMLQIVPGKSTWKIRVYAVVNLQLEGGRDQDDDDDDDMDGNEGKGMGSTKGAGKGGKATKRKDAATAKDDDDEENLVQQEEKILCLWKSYLKTSDFRKDLQPVQLRDLIGQGHNNIKRAHGQPNSSDRVLDGPAQMLQNFSRITITVGYNLPQPLNIKLDLVSPDPGPSASTPASLSSEERKNTPGPDPGGRLALDGLMQACTDLVGRANKVEAVTEAGSRGAGGRGGSQVPDTPNKRKRSRGSRSPEPKISLEEENVELKKRVSELERQLQHERREKSALASGHLPSDKSAVKLTAAKKGASLLQPGVKAAKPIIRGFVGSDEEDEWV